jgi:hypothetical protein
MGQFGNQPDFGTIAQSVTPIGYPSDNDGIAFAPSALYIGTGGNIVVSVVGGNIDGANGTTIFRNIPDGTFFPVIVTNVWVTDDNDYTTCSNIIALR